MNRLCLFIPSFSHLDRNNVTAISFTFKFPTQNLFLCKLDYKCMELFFSIKVLLWFEAVYGIGVTHESVKSSSIGYCFHFKLYYQKKIVLINMCWSFLKITCSLKVYKFYWFFFLQNYFSKLIHNSTHARYACKLFDTLTVLRYFSSMICIFIVTCFCHGIYSDLSYILQTLN